MVSRIDIYYQIHIDSYGHIIINSNNSTFGIVQYDYKAMLQVSIFKDYFQPLLF